MTSLPSVSVIIPVFNGAGTIGDLLTALTNQAATPAATEIIVVDNGSTDDTRLVVERYPSVRLTHESRRGPAAARNAGLRIATGDVILHCDADTLPTRRWLAELASKFVDPSVVLVAGRTLSFPPATNAEQYHAATQLYDAEVNISRPVLPFVASMNLGVRRDAALAVGGWNEEMMTSEDVDFCTRVLARFPSAIAYAEKAVLFHRNRSTDQALRNQAWTYGEGVADTYRRYPSIVSWGAPQYARLVPTMLGRALAPGFLQVLKGIGMSTAEEVRHARYHRMWTWWFWRGFFSFHRSGQYRQNQ